MGRRIGIALSVILGVAYLGLTVACSAFTHQVKVLDPALVDICERECVEFGKPEWAPLCGVADTIVNVMDRLAAIRRARMAQCHVEPASQ